VLEIDSRTNERKEMKKISSSQNYNELSTQLGQVELAPTLEGTSNS
jgi:hypothetical protein